jgi:hypothetical protein
VLVLAAGLSAAHFAVSANVTHTRDWREDASAKLMIEDLEHAAEAQRGASPVRLAVYPYFYPVTVFYARKSRLPIAVEVAPPRRGADFLYLRDGSQTEGMTVITRYSLSRNVLVRVSGSM